MKLKHFRKLLKKKQKLANYKHFVSRVKKNREFAQIGADILDENFPFLKGCGILNDDMLDVMAIGMTSLDEVKGGF